MLWAEMRKRSHFFRSKIVVKITVYILVPGIAFISQEVILTSTW